MVYSESEGTQKSTTNLTFGHEGTVNCCCNLKDEWYLAQALSWLWEADPIHKPIYENAAKNSVKMSLGGT